MFLGNATADCQTQYNGGLKVVMGCRWWRCIFGECNCGLLDAFSWWAQCGMALYYWRMQLQIARGRIVVGSRWEWVADGGKSAQK